MLNQIGKNIRIVRTQKGIGLNEFAEKVSVSSAYLSNLETGKTDTIRLALLERINIELDLIPTKNMEISEELNIRLQRIFNGLGKLNESNPEKAEYLISLVEKGLELFSE